MHRIPLRLRIILSFLVVTAVLVLAMPRTAKFGYDYKKGQAWKYDNLISQFDFPILKSEEQMQKERENARQGVIPYYIYSQDVVDAALLSLDALDFGDYSAFKPVAARAIQQIYAGGVVSDEGVRIDGSNPVEVLYVQKNRHALKMPVSEVYKLSEARQALRMKVREQTMSANADSVFAAGGVYNLILPNLIFDQQTTSLVHQEADNSVSPTMGYVSAGQLIVSNGEIITSEIAQVLDSYRKEYTSNIGYDGPMFLFWLGNIILAIAMVLILYYSILLTDKTIFRDRTFYYILLVFMLSSLISLLVQRVGDNILYLVPFSLFALFNFEFIRRKVVIVVYLASLLPLLVFTRSGVPLFVMWYLAGLVSIRAFKFLGKGWQQFLVAIINYAVTVGVYMGFRLLGYVSGDIFRILLFLFIASMLLVAGYPLVSLFERIFNLVSSRRLEELSNTGNPLIRKLEHAAPGTFQHSLQVMNMAATVCRAVGGDVPLIKAGALYHDIGKISNPQCFVENESLVTVDEKSKYHEDLDPVSSAHDIIRHVSDGLELCTHHNIPAVVRDFIATHHGTTLVGFFYTKYLNQGGSEDNAAEFRYPGHTPRTKEQIILMICDSVEAASRTLKTYNPETFDSFVEGIVDSKMSQGQFANADITIRELGIVKGVIKNYLAQIYHERVVYPKRKRSNK